MSAQTKLILYSVIELVLLSITVGCFEATYSIYWGGGLEGVFGGLLFAFFGWVPGLIGLILLPVNVFLIIMAIQAWRDYRRNEK